MDNMNIKEFKNICRVCMLESCINFTKDTLILNILHKLTDIHFDTNDELPQQICLKCFDLINEIHSFSMTCKRTHSVLVKCLKEQKIEEETNDQMELYNEITIKNDNGSTNDDVIEIKIDLLPLISTNIKTENKDNDLVNKESNSSDRECNTNNKKTEQNKHKRLRSSKKEYKCDECGKTFARLEKLKIHKCVHSGEHPYKCDQCEKSFNRLDSWKLHKRMHNGEYPYKCDECGKAFTGSCSLMRHKRAHSGQRPYKCDRCEKAFSRSDNLKFHQRVHNHNVK